MKVIVLGAGLVGAPMAIDLNRDEAFDVTVVDNNSDTLNRIKSNHPEISVIQMDVSDPDDVTHLVKDFNLAVNTGRPLADP